MVSNSSNFLRIMHQGSFSLNTKDCLAERRTTAIRTEGTNKTISTNDINIVCDRELVPIQTKSETVFNSRAKNNKRNKISFSFLKLILRKIHSYPF